MGQRINVIVIVLIRNPAPLKMIPRYIVIPLLCRTFQSCDNELTDPPLPQDVAFFEDSLVRRNFGEDKAEEREDYEYQEKEGAHYVSKTTKKISL